MICLVSISYQNSFFINLTPSFYLNKSLLVKNLSPQQFIELKEICIKKYSKLFDFASYQMMTDQNVLFQANIDSSKTLEGFGIQMKSNLSKIKYLGGVPRLFAYAYGGIAYHDLLTGEIVLPTKYDYPSTNYFRIKSIYHEVGHSLYYADDLANNIFQTKSMLHSSNDNIKALGYLMILGFTDFSLLPYLKLNQIDFYNEIIKKSKQNQIQVKKYYVANFLKNLFKKSKIQNKSVKYGYNKYYLSNTYLKTLYLSLKEIDNEK